MSSAPLVDPSAAPISTYSSLSPTTPRPKSKMPTKSTAEAMSGSASHAHGAASDPAASSAADPEVGLSSNIHDDYVPPTFASSLRATFFFSPLNALLVFIPLGIVSHFAGWSPIATFWLNFFAIVPLAKLLGFATEELALRTNPTVGGLLNATFGNAVEVIVAIMALSRDLVSVVQASLLGSILSNLLLVTGFSFLMGGLRFKEQRFNATAANTSGSLLAISVMALMVPAAFMAGTAHDGTDNKRLLDLSHGTALVLIVIYILYLGFQLSTHKHLYESAGDDENGEETEEELPVLTGAFAALLLLASTLVVALTSEYLVGSIEGLSEQWNLSQVFVGIILLPIVGNAAEHVSAVTSAMKNKMELAMGIAVGSSIQIALFVTPLLVIIGWATGKPMSLFYDTFDTAVLFMSVLIVNYLIQDGRSNWLEGAMLLGAYVIIAIAFFIHP